jgi:hypothetical protein
MVAQNKNRRWLFYRGCECNIERGILGF